MLVQVEVYESRRGVVEDHVDQLQRFSFLVRARLGTESEQDVFLAWVDDLYGLGADEFLLLPLRQIRKFPAYPRPEVLIDDADGCLHVDVTGYDDGHVVGNIPRIEVLVHPPQRRVLQVLDGADGRPLAIGVDFPQLSVHRIPDQPILVVDRPVLLFVHRLELGLEQTEDRVSEALRFDSRPLFKTV